MIKTFEHWLKIAENNQSNNLDESKKIHKYELHFSDGIRGMRGGENVDNLIRYAKSIKGIKEWSIFKTGTGFHGTHQDEFLVSWWDKDGNSYWSNRSVKEPKLLDKKHEEFKVNESKSLDLIDNMTRFEDISEIKDIIRSKVESTFKLKDVTFTRFGQTYYEYGYEGKGFRGRTRDEYIINLPNQDPIKYLNDKEKELLYALSPNFFNNSKNRTPIFLKATIGEAISIKDGQDDKKYHIIGIALYIYNADSNVLGAGGIYFNELLSGTSAAYAKVSMKSHNFITKGLLDNFYFKYNNSKEISSNTVSQGIGSAASDLVTTHYKDAWDVSALMDVFDNDKNKVIEFLKTNFHFNRLKNIQIDNNILHATSSSTIKYDSVNKDNTLNKVNESFDINRFRELSKLSQVQELTYILNKEFSNYTFVNDGLTIVCNTNIPQDELTYINDYIENLIGHNKYNIVSEKLTDKASNYISKKIVKLRDEGYPQKQAIAIAYSYAKKKGYKVDESFNSKTTNDFTPNDYMYYAKAIGKKLKDNNVYDYKIIYADSNDATGNGEGQFEIGNFIYEYNVFDYSNVDTKDGLEDKVNFKVRVYKDDFEIGYNKFTNIDSTNVESLITNYIVDLILTEGKNLNESHNGSGLIVKGRTDMDTEKIKDFLVSSDFYGEFDAAEDYFFFPEEESLLISLENLLQNEFDKLNIEVNITTTGLNESLSKQDIEILPQLLKLLKDLHSLRNKIKIRTEWVNGYWNIVFNDPEYISKEIMEKLKSIKTVNTFFDKSTLIVPYMENGKTVNIHFSKEAQKFLNIENFDKDDWKIENALLIIETKKEFDSISISNFLDKNSILVPNTTNESKRSNDLEDKIFSLKQELKELKEDRKQLMIDMENDPAVIDNTDGKEAQEYGEKLNKLDNDIQYTKNKLNKVEDSLHNLLNKSYKKNEPTTLSILKKNIDDINNSMKIFPNRTEEENAKIFKKRYNINDNEENIINSLNKLKNNVNEGSIFHDAPHQTNEDFWKTHFLSIIEELDFPKSYKIKEWKDLLDDDKEKIKIFRLSLFENINESLSKEKIDEHVLAFYIKYGKDYYNNDASILEFLQNNDEEHIDEESINQFKNALKDALKKYESHIPVFVNVKIQNWKQYFENSKHNDIYKKVLNLVTENVQNSNIKDIIKIDDIYEFKLISNNNDILLPTLIYEYIKK